MESQHHYVKTEGSKDKRVILEFSLSAEEPVQRCFSDEVLGHDEKSVNLTSLNSEVEPLILITI